MRLRDWLILRRKKKRHRGVGYSHWNLCEPVRTARGPRRPVVASLGKLDEAEAGGLRGTGRDLSHGDVGHRNREVNRGNGAPLFRQRFNSRNLSDG